MIHVGLASETGAGLRNKTLIKRHRWQTSQPLKSIEKDGTNARPIVTGGKADAVTEGNGSSLDSPCH